MLIDIIFGMQTLMHSPQGYSAFEIILKYTENLLGTKVVGEVFDDRLWVRYLWIEMYRIYLLSLFRNGWLGLIRFWEPCLPPIHKVAI